MILYDIADGQINQWMNNYEKWGYGGLNNKPKGRHNEKWKGLTPLQVRNQALQ